MKRIEPFLVNNLKEKLYFKLNKLILDASNRKPIPLS